MGRPAVQEAVLMGWVMVEAVPVQVFTIIRADMAIKAIRATRVVIINRGSTAAVGLPEPPEVVDKWEVSCLHH